jgi:hypothetical protein
MSKVGKNHEAEIEKICEDMKKLIMKPEHTATEVDAIHHYSEVIYYLTVVDAMKKAEETGEFSMNMAPVSMDGRSMRMMPSYDYSMEGRSMAGRRGRDNDNDGRYSEMHGRIPREVYDGESERYYGRY